MLIATAGILFLVLILSIIGRKTDAESRPVESVIEEGDVDVVSVTSPSLFDGVEDQAICGALGQKPYA